MSYVVIGGYLTSDDARDRVIVDLSNLEGKFAVTLDMTRNDSLSVVQALRLAETITRTISHAKNLVAAPELEQEALPL